MSRDVMKGHMNLFEKMHYKSGWIAEWLAVVASTSGANLLTT